MKPIKTSQLCDVLCAVVARGTSGTDRKTDMRTKGPPGPTSPHRHLRVLLAEDNPINQKVAVKMLAKMGYRADVVSNGLEALQASQQIPYDVVLMDCQMPEMDGYEATRQIRMREQEEHRKPIQIIAMTAHAMQGDREQCLAAGMNDYLSKPVRPNELAQILERCRRLRLPDDRDAGADPPKLNLEQPSVACPAAAGEPQPVATEPEEPPLDTESLDGISEGDPEGARELIELYLQQAEDTIKGLQTAIDAGVAQDVDRLAHKLAGSSAVCGVTAMMAPLRATRATRPRGPIVRRERVACPGEATVRSEPTLLGPVPPGIRTPADDL